MYRLAFLFVVALPSLADELTVPHPPQDSQIASGTEMATNLQAIVDESNENDVRIQTLEENLRASSNSIIGGGGSGLITSDLSCYGEPLTFANTAFGVAALDSLAGGAFNTAVGANALNLVQGEIEEAFDITEGPSGYCSSLSGSSNTALGAYAMSDALSVTNNVAIGVRALQASSSNYSVGIGSYVLSLSDGDYNTGVGYGSLANALGSYNTTLGYNTLSSAQASRFNTAIGYRAMTNSSEPGEGNVAVGAQALLRTTTGKNTALGMSALSNDLSSEGRNTAIGYEALGGANGTTTLATAVGYMADPNSQESTAVGALSTVDSSMSVAIGASSSIATLSNKSIAIGYNASIGDSALQSIAIGADTEVTTNFTVQIGGDNTTTVQFGRQQPLAGGLTANLLTLGKLTTGDITLPNEDGEAGQVMATDGQGVVVWSDPPSVETIRESITYVQSEASAALARAYCPIPKKAVGGGCIGRVQGSYPERDGENWICVNDSSVTVTAYAICL